MQLKMPLKNPVECSELVNHNLRKKKTWAIQELKLINPLSIV